MRPVDRPYSSSGTSSSDPERPTRPPAMPRYLREAGNGIAETDHGLDRGRWKSGRGRGGGGREEIRPRRLDGESGVYAQGVHGWILHTRMYLCDIHRDRRGRDGCVKYIGAGEAETGL
jgi:hypothetical protein